MSRYAAVLSAHAIDQIVSSVNSKRETVICTCGRQLSSEESRAMAKMYWAEHVSNEIHKLGRAPTNV